VSPPPATVGDLVAALEEIAPTRHAEPWDNVGLLAGDPASPLTRALLCIDYTAAVADEARASGCEAVVAYHPPLFQAKKRILPGDGVFEAIRDGIALYSPHTALDVAEGGTNDVLGDIVGMTARRPLRGLALKDTHHKLVTFVPAEQVDSLAEALFQAGAGRIGRYRSCSFRSAGTGTFHGEEGASPAVGQAGRLESVEEIRLETVVPVGRVEAVIAAMRKYHPYEEPAFDLVRLAAPAAGRGIGRVGAVAPVTRGALIEAIKAGLGLERALVAGPLEGEITSVAVCAGAGGELLDDVLSSGAGLFLTGELRHHDALRAARAGVTVVCALHSNSERVTLGHLAPRLGAKVPGVRFDVSLRDADPFSMR
jgi:dinuclear metal center YbgI/SA1388 family protein